MLTMTDSPTFDTAPQAIAHLVANDPRFAVGKAVIRGIDCRVFANAPTNLRDMMQRAAADHGDGDFVVYQGERLAYDAFCTRMNQIAHGLLAIGARPGDRIAIAMRNYPELLMAMMAITTAGMVAVPLNAWWTADELAYAFSDSEARICFADAPRAERIASFAGRMGITMIGVRDGVDLCQTTLADLIAGQPGDWSDAPIAPDDDAMVMYSSGSTGHPKGVVQSHRGAISAVYTWVLGGLAAQMVTPPAETPPADTPPADTPPGTTPTTEVRPIVLVCTPLFHVTATHPLWLQGIVVGAKMVLLRKWDAEEAVRTVEREQITRMVGVPTQTFDLIAAAKTLGSKLETLHFVGSGGAKRPPAQVSEIANAFPSKVVATGWGMTETNAVGLGFSGPDYVARPGAAGRLQPPLQDMKICGSDGNELPDGEVGEIVVKSPANMRGYLNKPEATAEVLKDGWLFTGDLAWRDDDGVYTIVDRKKSIIIRGGENISAQEVEEAIHRHPYVLEAGVFSVPDQRLGEVPGAGIVLRPGRSLSRADLREFLAASLAPFKIPDHIWLREAALPRGATDKIDRRGLRAECLANLQEIGETA